jgi:hypothetical protein
MIQERPIALMLHRFSEKVPRIEIGTDSSLGWGND